MSTRVILSWLAAAVILGGIALYLFQTGGSKASPVGRYAQGERLIEFNPADLVQIEFKAPDRGREVITRSSLRGGAGSGMGDGSDAAWVLTLEHPSGVKVPTSAPGGSGIDWPLVDSRVQAFLQKLQETRCVSTPQDDASVVGATAGAGAAGSSPTVIRLIFAAKSAGAGSSGQSGAAPRTVQINLSGTTLAGTGLVEVIDDRPQGSEASSGAGRGTAGGTSKPGLARLAIVDDWLQRVSATPGPRAWRDPTALRMARADVSRVRLESSVPGGLRVVSIARVDGRWGLREPVSAPADREAVVKLLGTLSSVNIADFLDNGPGGADTRLDRPVAQVTLEYDQRAINNATGNVATNTLTNRLELGGPAALGSAATGGGTDRLYAKIDGERVVTVDAKPLAALAADPATFVWPFPTTQLPADIGTVLLEVRTPDGGSIEPSISTSGVSTTSAAPGASISPDQLQRVLRRSLDRWTRVNADGSESPLVDDSLRQVDDLLGFLTGSSTSPVKPAAIALSTPARFVQFGRISLLSLGAGALEQIEVGESGAGLVTLKTGPVYRTYSEDKLPVLVAELRARAKAAGVPIDGWGGSGDAGANASGETLTK